MPITIKRAYEPRTRGDGYRFLCDRFYPRGVSKEKLHAKSISHLAPSTELIDWFHVNPAARWTEFVKRYRAEIAGRDSPHLEAVKKLALFARDHNVTLVYGSHDEKYNNARALKLILTRIGARL